MISVDIRRGKKVTRNAPPDRVSDVLRTDQQTVWVDVHEPTEADWKTLEEECRFHPLAMEDAQKQNQRAKAETRRKFRRILRRRTPRRARRNCARRFVTNAP